jgi:L-ascorbate metabolism protein UlaG (beta-lactamase superfamily)
VSTSAGDLIVHPINHASLALGWSNLVVYADPVGGTSRYANLPKPDLVLLTHIHADHFNVATLKATTTDQTRIVAPPAVAVNLPPEWAGRVTVLTNGQSAVVAGVRCTAVAAYNLSAERVQYHPKGQGNGYVLELSGKHIYISGDTEDVPEMRALKSMDVAFVCMNLPYTMTVEQAADAVRAFRPKLVYPYHSRGSNLDKFKQLVGEGIGVEVCLSNWYE